jgi:hypothetical protein
MTRVSLVFSPTRRFRFRGANAFVSARVAHRAVYRHRFFSIFFLATKIIRPFAISNAINLGGILCAEVCMATNEKLIKFQFRGGSRDGQIIRSDESKDGVNEATIFWAMTRQGTSGKRFDAPVPHRPTSPHRYKVVDRIEIADEIVVSCEAVDTA